MNFSTGGLSHLNRPKGPYARRFKRPLKNGVPNIMLSDSWRVRHEVPDFQEGVAYTRRELLLITEKILLEDPKPITETPCILFISHLRDRQRREIYNGNGVPDPSIQSGLYWRTHPQGRPWRSREERRKGNGASFYK